MLINTFSFLAIVWLTLAPAVLGNHYKCQGISKPDNWPQWCTAPRGSDNKYHCTTVPSGSPFPNAQVADYGYFLGQARTLELGASTHCPI